MSAELSTDTITKLKVPSLYKVVLLNDNYTPMDFVIRLLEEVFSMNYNEAYKLCMEVHQNGRGVAGIYSKEVAKQKEVECTHIAKEWKHPLKAIVEEA